MDLDELVALRDQIDAEILRKRGPPIEERDIGDIGLAPRAVTALRLAGINHLAGLLAFSEGRLMCVPGMGLSSFMSVKESLDALGLSLRSRP
jgi:DNA-directed RNA polymerase alpha subunit